MEELFAITSWLSAALTTALLGWLFFRRRHMFVRPSVIILIFFNLRIQWAAAVESFHIFDALFAPWHFWLLTQAMPLLILAPLCAVKSTLSERVWKGLQEPVPPEAHRDMRRVTVLLLVGFGIIAFYYLTVVPFRQTGLYMIVTNPLRSIQAREESLKLIPNPVLRYSYSWARDLVGPLAAALVTLNLIERRRQMAKLKALGGHVALLGLIVIGVSFTGARAGAAGVTLAIILTVWLRKGTPFRAVYLLVGALVVLSGPVVITILRGGEALSFDRFVNYMFGPMFGRVFVTPMETCLWHVHFPQVNDFVGVRGIRPLAILFGEEYVNLPNVIGLAYAANPILTVSANTSFVHDFYACFGLFSIPLSVACWLGLDLFLVPLRRPSPINAAIIAVLWLRCSFFMSSAYLVNFTTHGLLLLFVFAVFWQRRLGKREAQLHPSLTPGGARL